MKVVFFHFAPPPHSSFRFPLFFCRYGRNRNQKSFSCLVFSSLKICEELSANQNSESQQILSLQIRQVESRSGQFIKDFSTLKYVSLFFLLCRLTTEAMGIWRFAGAFAVVKRQSECGSKTAGMHFSQPMSHRRLLAAGFMFHFLLLSNLQL